VDATGPLARLWALASLNRPLRMRTYAGHVLDNPRSPKVRAVAKLAKKQRRHEAGLFLVEGPQAVREALEFRPELVVDIFVTQAVKDRYVEILDSAREHSIEITDATDAVINQMADTVTPQGILAVVELLEFSVDQVMKSSPHLIALLHEVQDPGNLGNIIRSADAAGADGVMMTSKSVDVFNPKVVRASTGSLFHLPIVFGLELSEAVQALRKAGLQILAADAGGDTIVSLREKGLLARPTAWLLGNEANGLSSADQELADSVVAIPLYGKAESLSLPTAAAVCLYESAFAKRREG
jgi:RNA methyltransferase, TrmH family